MEEENVLNIFTRGFEEGKKYNISSEAVRVNDVIKVEVDGLSAEWEYFKEKAIQIVGAILVSMLGYGVWVGTIQTTVSGLKEDNEQLKKESKEAAISNAKLITELGAVKTSLDEIKIALGIRK